MKRQIQALSLSFSLLAPIFCQGPAQYAWAKPLQVAATTPVRADADDQVVQVLNRLTLGAAPGDFDRVKAMGVKAYIQSQLHPESIAEAEIVDNQVRSADIIHMKSSDLIQKYRMALQQQKALKKQQAQAQDAADGSEKKDAMMADANTAGNNLRNAVGSGKIGKGKIGNGKNGQNIKGNNQKKTYVRDTAEAIIKTRLVRAIYSQRQLQEVMVDFWFNHFNISINKGLDRVLVGPYEEQAIRPNVLGKFRDILGATCYHPAMLFYLDNAQNAAAGTPGPKGKKIGLNENYARELMELHTLGVDGGYSQKDVIELARVLTGLSIPLPGLRRMAAENNSASAGYFGQFYPARHDRGEKVILGHKIAASGAKEIEEALDLLARHPSTAKHISYKLAQYFVADEPPPALVQRLAQKFTESDGDIKSVLTTLFDSPEFFDNRNLNAKYKSPYRYAISALRATGAQPARYELVANFLKMQGQPLYGCLTPDGYKNTKAAWLNSDALLKRINFATALGSGAMPQIGGIVSYDQIADTVNGGKLNAKTEAVIAKTPPPLKAAILLGSPDFMSY